MKTILILPLISMIFLTGCATKRDPFTTKESQVYKGKKITYTNRKKPEFVVMTHMGGLTGGLQFYDSISPKVTANTTKGAYEEIENPTNILRDNLIKKLAKTYQLEIDHPSQVTKTRDKITIANDHKYADLVLDVTTAMTCIYIPFRFKSYDILLYSDMRLIATADSKIIASESYRLKASDKYSRYFTLDEVLQDSGAFYRSEVQDFLNNSLVQFETNSLFTVKNTESESGKGECLATPPHTTKHAAPHLAARKTPSD